MIQGGGTLAVFPSSVLSRTYQTAHVLTDLFSEPGFIRPVILAPSSWRPQRERAIHRFYET